MAQEAEAERERRAKIISADGEVQRASRLKEASDTIGQSPNALQLAYLQAMTEITGEGKTTIVLPIPIETIKSFMDLSSKKLQ